ncbi:MAG TPA: DUF3883 domain-containing protein, partial [Pirellulales bacterium]|nr:DUF3883 domain-containing protein [Pirellulales bacterium]
HPLLDATIDLVIERHRDLLKRGAVLVDERDPGDKPRVLVYLEHSIQDARTDRAGNRRVVSKRFQFVEIDVQGKTSAAGPAPYLDYRPLTVAEIARIQDALPTFPWQRDDLERQVQEHAAIHLVPEHLGELRGRKEELIDKTIAAVKDRLTKEINYWDHRAAQLKDQELAGRVNARLNSGLARQRADDLTARLQKRLDELAQERKLSPLPTVVLGGAMIIPAALLRRLAGDAASVPPTFAHDTERSELLAMEAVMQAERSLGYSPRDVSDQKWGYDIESAVPNTGRLRFIEVKGRALGAATVTITKNEILTGLNKPDDFILAIGLVNGDGVETHYIRRPFQREPDFAVTSVNFDLDKLLARAEEPA